MSKQFWLIIIVIVVALIGIFSFTGKNKTNTGSSNSSSSKPTEHIEGLGKDHVTLVEYGDYQCPYCGEYASTITQIAAEYNTQITFQFRNFPLTSIHQNAFAGARAAEAAGLMGKFWQMHDLLYTQNQEYYDSNGSDPTWIGASNPETVFEQDAASLGLNVQKFEQYYASDQVNNLITADETAGNNLNIDATPTFYLDGKAIEADNTVAAFQKLINAAIAKKTGTTATAS
jgi:protein-disulfide isomerase